MLCGVKVKVKRRADDQKFLAQVLAVGTDCDIALLTVEDEAFWEGVTPLELGPLPTLQVGCTAQMAHLTWPVFACELVYGCHEGWRSLKDEKMRTPRSLSVLQDAVAVVGYPIGGETISVTTGVVSRIEVTSYSHGATELLGIQIDAAINPGNSGAALLMQGNEPSIIL